MPSAFSLVTRALIGPRGKLSTPYSNQRYVEAISKQLGIKPGDKKWAHKVADNVGVHPDSVRRWKRGERPTHNPALAKSFLRNNIKPGKETQIRNSGGPIVTAIIEVSDVEHEQRMYLGRYAKTEMTPRMPNMAGKMVDSYLAGGHPTDIVFDVARSYLKNFGGTLVGIKAITF